MNGPFDMGDVSPRRYFAAAAVVLGLLFAFVAGDDETPGMLLRSLVLWQVQACVPMVLLLLSHICWLRIALFEALSPWAQLLISGLTGSVLFSPVAVLLDRVLEGDPGQLDWISILEEALNIAPPITLAWIAMNAPFVLGLRLTNTAGGRSRAVRGEAAAWSPPRGAPARADDDPADAVHTGESVPEPAFMALVAPTARGRLIYLQAELHYLAVVTDRGRSLILYNLRDAINELPEDYGLITHRSFWVVREAVRDYRRVGRQGTLIVDNGDEVPVSRRRIGDVQSLLGSFDQVA
jgi:hypothetical protein